MSDSWEDVLSRLRVLIKSGPDSMSAHARKLGLSPAGLSRILNGTTQAPQPSTQRRIREYLEPVSERRPRRALQVRERGGEYRVGDEGNGSGSTSVADATQATPEQELLEFFLQNDRPLATFMETTTEGLPVEERRTVALAILNGVKRLAIQAGEPIPSALYEIERRFVAE